MKKIISFALLFVLILSMILSCSENSGNSKSEETSAANTGQDETTTIEDPKKLPDPKFGNYNLNGRAFNILRAPIDAFVVNDFEYFPESAGEPINDAIRERNIAMEELYNCVITSIYSSVISAARKEILADGHTYDAIMPALIEVYALAGEGLLLDMNKIDTMHFDMPWWSSDACENLSILHRLYYTLSNISLGDKTGMGALGFNKALLQQYELASPYECVYNNTWTIDTFYDMCRGVSRDLDGDGKMTKEDQYGLVTDYGNILGMINASGIKLVTKNSEDIPEPSINTPRTLNVIDKVIQIYRDETVFGQVDLFGGHEQVNAPFKNNQILFRHTSMYRFSQVRDMESDFGFIPFPKYDELQERYYTGYSYACPGVAIPITSNPEETGAVLEALAYYGRSIVLPAYYEITLKTKITRDEDSPKMLDILFDSATIDLGYVYNFGGMRDIYGAFVSKNENTFPSKYASIEPKILSEIEKLVETFRSFS